MELVACLVKIANMGVSCFSILSWSISRFFYFWDNYALWYPSIF